MFDRLVPETQRIPHFAERCRQIVDKLVVVERGRSDPKPLGTAGDRRIVDRLDVDGEFLQEPRRRAPQDAVKAIEKTPAGFSVRASSHGNDEVFSADLVVHAAGRVPDLEPLDLAAAGIEAEKGRLRLNEFLQSVSNPAVYAAGDAASKGPPLTPVASHDARVAAANMLNGNRETPDYLGVPSVAFTIPPIAAVGMSEKQAREQGLKFRMQHERASDWYTARRVAETIYGFKVLIEERTDRILGAHLVGPHADEVINVFALAVRNGLTTKDIKRTIFAYPTGASDIGYML